MVGRRALGDALSLIYRDRWSVGLFAANFGNKTDHGFGEGKRELVCRASDSYRDDVWMGFCFGMVGLFAKQEHTRQDQTDVENHWN